MDMSWQTTFALACAAVFAAIVPGTLGYTSARLETAAQQRHEMVRLHAELQAARQVVQQVSTPCKPQASGRSGDTPATGPSGDQPALAPAHPQAKSDKPADVTAPDTELDPAWDQE
ncbi:hypothetical protein AB0O34_11660 [Sphaerisporangium sp. NPDC088356]|uniref:hypothetical protein n=1 Tax=Sphaerisporangium sp. NPDC088356 TaxID=3154871 RepID=UPI0034142750